MTNLLIWGTGTIAEVANYYFTNYTSYQIVAHVEEIVPASKYGFNFPNKIISIEEALATYSPRDTEFFVAIGYRKTNKVRERRFSEVKSFGYKCASFISEKAAIFTDKIGENCFILENNVIQPFSCIHDNVIIWSGNHIGHHSVVEKNTFMSSHVVLSGKCRVGQNSFLGVNSTVHDGVTIGEFSVLGAGSLVTASCEPYSIFRPEATKSKIISRDLI